MGMHNTDRIQVSHAGALPRPADLQRLFAAGPAGEEAFREALPGAVAEVVDQQVSAGVDIVNDGEVCKRGLFIGYVRDRMAGFEARSFPAGTYQPPDAGVTGRDRRDFPGFFAAGLGGFRFGAAAAPSRAAEPELVTEYFCTGPLRYTGAASVRADIDRLSAAVKDARARGHDGVQGFLPAITPGTVEHWLRNEFYPTRSRSCSPMADVLNEEYQAITDAGLILQVDDPDLPDGWQMFPDMTVPEYRRYAALRVEALNQALRGLPEEQVRLHICWGSHHGPHRDDIPLRDLVDLVLSVRAGLLFGRGGQPAARARMGGLGRGPAAGREVPHAGGGRARQRHHRAPGTGRAAADPVRRAGRPGERHRGNRLRPGRPGGPPGDRLGQAGRPRGRRPDRLPAPLAITFRVRPP